MKNAWLPIALALAGCSDGGNPDGGLPDAAAPMPSTAGKDIDQREPRSLPDRCTPPKPFYDGLTAAGLTPPQLTQPDFGITFNTDVNRLHWTDEIRRQGDLAPRFACMAAATVEAALAGGDSDVRVRELLVAQGIFGDRAAYQASRYDRAFTVDATARPLLAALEQYYRHPRVAGDPAPALPPWESVADGVAAQVATLSPRTQVALAQAILGLVAAADLRDQALTRSGKLKLTDWPAQIDTFLVGRGSGSITSFGDAYKAANKMTAAMDYEWLSRAGQLASRAVESLRIALAGEPLQPGAALDFTGPLGRIVVSMEDHDDTRTGANHFLLLDGGGNDTYHDAVAANPDLYHPITAVIDLAGNDKYIPAEAWDLLQDGLPLDEGPSTGQAAGWFGVAILDDAAGDDVYQTGYYQAYGLWGVGVLADHGGKDLYKGYNRSQGAADFGYGLLVDLGGGDDRHETLHNSQGFGGTRGIGWLVDDAGDDRYLAVTTPLKGDPSNNPYDREGSNFSGAQGFGWGLRVWDNTGKAVAYLSGGLGALFDLAGNDNYECAVMCQAWGYFYGAGLLWDKAGNDSYKTWHKYGIGGATHQAIGVFIDEKGADTYEYTAGGIPTNGGSEGVGLGYDLSVGFHIDRGPEPDQYNFLMDKQQWGEVMGTARFPGVGVFINEAGDDGYHIPGKMGAYALGMVDMPNQNPPVRSGALAKVTSLGMFLDLGGRDTYDAQGSKAANNTTWKQDAATTNAPQDPFDPAVDHGYGFDGSYTWAPW